jgi:hypothetical protein
MGYLYEQSADYPIKEALDIFTDGLEAFIAESRFAWGQQRLLVDRPWRNVRSRLDSLAPGSVYTARQMSACQND